MHTIFEIHTFNLYLSTNKLLYVIKEIYIYIYLLSIL